MKLQLKSLCILAAVAAFMPSEAQAEEVYRDNHVRFTLIDEGTLRLEYAPDGKFVDNKSFVAVIREYGNVPHKASLGGNKVVITTSKLKLTYKKGDAPLSAQNLTITAAKDLGTHTLFIANITEAVHLSDDPSLTYAYYQEHIKPKPAVAPRTEGGTKKWVCEVCGYVYEGDELPADFICPWCKHPASDFKLVE